MLDNSLCFSHLLQVQLSAVTPPPTAPVIPTSLEDSLSGLSITAAPPTMPSELQTGVSTLISGLSFHSHHVDAWPSSPGLPTVPLLPSSTSPSFSPLAPLNSAATGFNPATTLPGERLCDVVAVIKPKATLHLALFVRVTTGLMPLAGGLPPLPNLPNLNLPLPDLSSVSLPVGSTGKCIYFLILHNTTHNFD